jgi:hypothetical protein
MLKCTPRLIYMKHTTWCAFKKVMNGKGHWELVIAILNMLQCHLALPMQGCYLVSMWAWTSEPKWFFSRISYWHQHNIFWHMGRIFGDMEAYSTTCHGWTILLDEKGWKRMNFYKGWMPNLWKMMDDPLSHS